jgi:hypothetical protein
MSSAPLDVLIPTCERPAALAVTLAGLTGQSWQDFRVIISDQGELQLAEQSAEVQAVSRVLRAQGREVRLQRHLPRRGLAEQRQFLLDQARAPCVLFLDDDLILEPFVLGQLMKVLAREQCGFVGSAVIGLSFLADVRPQEQAIEFWNGPVRPETVTPGSPAWARHLLHNAANLFHVQNALGLTPESTRTYRVAWSGGCVLYDTARLRSTGGFGFWRELPPVHSGEDVLAQLRVMARHGGCGVIPSGVFHQELPTTVTDRRVDAPQVLPVVDHAAGREAG